MSKAGNRLLRTTLIRAADNARRHDPQLAKIYYVQMVQRGADHLKACCVVAAHLAERLHTVLVRGMPYVICDTDGTPVDPATAKQIIAERWTVPAAVRAHRRSRKTTLRPIPSTRAGKALSKGGRAICAPRRREVDSEAVRGNQSRPSTACRAESTACMSVWSSRPANSPRRVCGSIAVSCSTMTRVLVALISMSGRKDAARRPVEVGAMIQVDSGSSSDCTTTA
jgi:hypothetical protein